jgi:hypothetical protein
MGGTPWDFGPGVHTLKLSLVILMYLYYSDDQKIGFFEKRSFIRELNKMEELTQKDRLELKSMFSEIVDSAYVLQYVKSNKLDKHFIDYALEVVRTTFKLHSKYLEYLQQLEGKLHINQ